MDENTLGLFLNQNPVLTYLGVMTVVLPLLLAIVMQSRWSSEVKGLLSIGACFLASAGWYVVERWQTSEWIVTAVALVGLTGALYRIMPRTLDELSRRTDLP